MATTNTVSSMQPNLKEQYSSKFKKLKSAVKPKKCPCDKECSCKKKK